MYMYKILEMWALDQIMKVMQLLEKLLYFLQQQIEESW